MSMVHEADGEKRTERGEVDHVLGGDERGASEGEEAGEIVHLDGSH